MECRDEETGSATGAQASNAASEALGTFIIPAEVLMVLGSFVMTGANVSVKMLQAVPLLCLVQIRYFLQWVLSFSALLARSYSSGMAFQPFGPPGQKHWLILRALAYYAFILTWWSTLRLVPVGDASVIVKIEVFFMGLLGNLFLGERLSLRWWIACIVSFFGVLLVIRPPIIFGSSAAIASTDLAHARMLGYLVNILAATLGAIDIVLMKFAPDAHFLEVQHATDFTAGLVLSPMMVSMYGSSADLFNIHVLKAGSANAMFGFVALCLIVMSYQRGTASRIGLVSLIEVPFAYFAQVFLFGVPLQMTAVVGTILIVAASVATSFEPTGDSVAESDAPLSTKVMDVYCRSCAWMYGSTHKAPSRSKGRSL